MAGLVSGASSFKSRINTLTASDEMTDEAGKRVAAEVGKVVGELKTELAADQQALADAEKTLDSFSYVARVGGFFKSLVGATTEARQASEDVDALRVEVQEDQSVLASAEYKVDWFGDLSGNKARAEAERVAREAAERAQREADERLRMQCILDGDSSGLQGCGRVAPGWATNQNW